jgi:flagellar biosynthesis chaperone FliJ
MVSKKRGAKNKTEMQELSEFIRDHMATKSDLADFKVELNTDFTQLEDKLEKLATKNDVAALNRSISRELEAITQQQKNVSGFGKEIDHALERIAAIEKHLGITKKIAA